MSWSWVWQMTQIYLQILDLMYVECTSNDTHYNAISILLKKLVCLLRNSASRVFANQYTNTN